MRGLGKGAESRYGGRGKHRASGAEGGKQKGAGNEAKKTTPKSTGRKERGKGVRKVSHEKEKDE